MVISNHQKDIFHHGNDDAKKGKPPDLTSPKAAHAVGAYIQWI